MANLGFQLRETIWNLEDIRDNMEVHLPDEQMNELVKIIAELYDQLVDLINSEIKIATKEYEEAAEAMGDAAVNAKKAIKKLTKVEEAMKMVAKAVEKVAVLLPAV